MTRTAMRWCRSAALACLVAWAACSKTTRPAAESNTNWLLACSTDSDCGDGLQCACGVCTLDCEDQARCEQEDPATTCASLSTACGQASEGSACFARCDDDSPCEVEGTVCGDARLCTAPPDSASPPLDSGTPPLVQTPGELQGLLERDHPEWISCQDTGDCGLLQPGNCCSICGPHEAGDFVAVRVENHLDAQALVTQCDPGGPCPSIFCYQQNLIPQCRQGRCAVVDLQQDDLLSACDTDSDCALRSGSECCAPCNTGSPTFAFRADLDLDNALCGQRPCDCEIAPQDPIEEVARCIEGHCAAVLEP